MTPQTPQNSPQAAPSQGQQGTQAQGLLQTIEAKIAERVPPKMRGELDRAVTAGLLIMHSPQSHQLMVKQLTKPGDPSANAGEGAAKLVVLLLNQSRGRVPMPVLVAAGQILLCEGLFFMAQAGQIQINNQTVAMATQEYASTLLQMLGVTPDKMQAMAVQAQGMRQQGGMPQQGMPQGAPGLKPAQAPAASGGIIQRARQGA
jgi:hypothetical protein